MRPSRLSPLLITAVFLSGCAGVSVYQYGANHLSTDVKEVTKSLSDSAEQRCTVNGLKIEYLGIKHKQTELTRENVRNGLDQRTEIQFRCVDPDTNHPKEAPYPAPLPDTGNMTLPAAVQHMKEMMDLADQKASATTTETIHSDKPINAELPFKN